MNDIRVFFLGGGGGASGLRKGMGQVKVEKMCLGMLGK